MYVKFNSDYMQVYFGNKPDSVTQEGSFYVDGHSLTFYALGGVEEKVIYKYNNMYIF